MLRPAFDRRAAIADARKRCAGEVPSLRIFDRDFAFLAGSQGNVTSQNGEDGVLAALFDRIGARSQWCFEVGAHDGIRCANTWILRQSGWQAVLIEADDLLFDRLQANCYGRAHLFHERITPDSLDLILAGVGMPLDLDLGVIDIDGEDLRVWEGLQVHRPRVMLVEFNPAGDGIQGGRAEWQAGLDSIATLGHHKGYLLAATMVCNALFVDKGAL